ncbi:MAG TPA: FxsB family cyclophane-forming radical SAM/SPASM peptide maturase [Pseudonocardiaceae bacterium]|nr:FxsB family cyclophane-forming radical SAM/SPASM peptide maturase [Pseudonocardiaceae bacterium]
MNGLAFRQFLVKVHSRCNLACDYCYVYELADQSWRRQPPVMSTETLTRTASRIAEHALAHDLAEVHVVLHGGEPLLAGHGYFRALTDTFRVVAGSSVRLRFTMQSNGTLLDTAFLDELLAAEVRVGISMDGEANEHDRHRAHRDGRGSSSAVDQALARLNQPAYRSLFAGLLCVIDPRTDPLRTYTRLLEFDPPEVDFLLPHGNWTTEPPHLGRPETPYADWLIALFDRWYDASRQETEIRLFTEIIRLLLGGASTIESIGLSPVALLVIETNGELEQSDALKSTVDGAARTGLNVFEHELDAALTHHGIQARHIGIDALGPTCRSCRQVQVCGGGLYAHRYRAGAGFANPSVYCADLLRLIDHIQARITADIGRPAPVRPVPG